MRIAIGRTRVAIPAFGAFRMLGVVIAHTAGVRHHGVAAPSHFMVTCSITEESLADCAASL